MLTYQMLQTRSWLLRTLSSKRLLRLPSLNAASERVQLSSTSAVSGSAVKDLKKVSGPGLKDFIKASGQNRALKITPEESHPYLSEESLQGHGRRGTSSSDHMIFLSVTYLYANC